MRKDLIDRIMSAAGLLVRVCVYVMLVLPAVIVIVSSFTADNVLRFPPTGFSLRWYQSAFANEEFMSSLWTSTYIGLLAAALALGVGFAAAFAIDRYEFPGRAAFQSLALSPLIVPGVVLGIGMLYLLAWSGLNQTVAGILFAHVVLAIPYVVRTTLASLSLFDRRLEEAAMNLRAPPWIVLRRVTLPMLLPGVLSAAVFAFVVSFGNVTVTAFLTYDDTVTLPVRLFSYVQQSSGPFVAAISSIMIAVTLIVILMIERLIGAERLA
jgi:putative spermidine/putrescine transport system permease protein